MSVAEVDNLVEEAGYYIDVFEGTLIADLLRNDLRSSDWDALREHLSEAKIMEATNAEN